jgi:hypothetical protein
MPEACSDQGSGAYHSREAQLSRRDGLQNRGASRSLSVSAYELPLPLGLAAHRR